MRYDAVMRTTLSIDDDVLTEVKAIASHQDRSLGEVVSELVRRALERPVPGKVYRNGIPILPDTGGPRVTLEFVNRLRDELP